VKKLLRWFIVVLLVSSTLAISAVGIIYLVLAPGLPDVETLRDVQLQVPLRVFSEDGKLLGIFGEKRRIPVTIEQVPDQLKNAFLAGEDARFYVHPGVDYQGISRAAWSLLTTGEKAIGGSTITQQLARNFFLTSEKTFTRKIKEIFLALKIERLSSLRCRGCRRSLLWQIHITAVIGAMRHDCSTSKGAVQDQPDQLP